MNQHRGYVIVTDSNENIDRMERILDTRGYSGTTVVWLDNAYPFSVPAYLIIHPN